MSAAVIVTPTLTSAAEQVSVYDADTAKNSSSTSSFEGEDHVCHDHDNDHCHDCEFEGTGHGVKIALLDAGVTEYDTFKQVSFIDDKTVGSDHGDLMMSILSEKVPEADIMDVRVLDDDGKGTYADVSKGIHWAVDNDADIIVMSFAGQSNSALLGEAVEYAEKNNVFVVAAAGNSYCEQMFFPAAFDTVISVGAIDADGNIYDFSNYGQYVDTYGENSNGTSGAAQVVAASAAVAVEFEGDISAAELRKDFQLNPKTFVPKSEEENADDVVYATGCTKHNWESTWHTRKKATCTKGGVEYRVCKNYGCGQEQTRNTSALGHNYSWVKTASPTCTASGKESYKCSICGNVSSTRSISPLGHAWESTWHVTKQPTCTATGSQYRACTRYGCGATTTQSIAMKSHTYSWVTTKQPTCTATGTQSYKCTGCGKVSDTKTLAALGHAWESTWHVTKQATCTTKGSQYKACTRYGCTARDTVDIPKTSHTYKWVKTKDPTCTADGVETKKCSVCGATDGTRKITAPGHSWEQNWHVIKDSTCTVKGSKYKACTKYGCTARDTVDIPLKSHTYKWVTTKEPTCTGDGIETNKCTVCGAANGTRSISAPGHSWEQNWHVTKDSTCTEKGSKFRACTKYGCTARDTVDIPLKSHSYSWVTTLQPTCTSTGKKVYKCSVCGDINKTEIIDIPGHDWENWRVIKEAVSCAEPGKKSRACKKYGCGTVETQDIIIPHKYSWITTVQPTCTNTGKRVYKCSVCGDVNKTEILDRTEHDFEDWRVTKAATCTVDGSMTRACKRYGCGTVETQTIKAPGHNYQYVVTKKPDFYNQGVEEEQCIKCKAKTGKTRKTDLVEFLPQVDNMLPFLFDFYGNAVERPGLDPVANYNGRTVISLTFTSNYAWSITVPSYVNVHNKDTGKAISSGKAGTYTLYIWMEQNKHLENVTSIPQLTFNIENAKYTYNLNLYCINNVPAYEYIRNISGHINDVTKSNGAVDYLCGNIMTGNKIKEFEYDLKSCIAISSRLNDDGNVTIEYVIFTPDADFTTSTLNNAPYNQLDVSITLIEAYGMKICQDADNPIFKTSNTISQAYVSATDEEYAAALERAGYASYVAKFLANVGLAVWGPKQPLISVGLGEGVGKTIDTLSMVDFETFHVDHGTDANIYNSSLKINDGCSLGENDKLECILAKCYSRNNINSASIHVLLKDSQNHSLPFDFESGSFSSKNTGAQITTTTTTVKSITTTTKPVATTTKPVATTTKPVATTTKPVATTTKPVATTTKPVATTTTTKPVATTTKPVATTTKPVATTTKPVATTTKPVVTTTKPVVTTTKPVATTTKPVATTTKPVATTTKPVVTTTKPVVTTTKPVVTTTKPVVTTTKPVATTTKPVATTTKPVATTTKPVVTTTKPVVTTTKPVATTTKPVATTKPVVTTTKPVATTTKPVVTTTKPVVTTTKPVVTTTKPVATTTKPVATTTKPVVTTTKPVATTTKLVVTTTIAPETTTAVVTTSPTTTTVAQPSFGDPNGDHKINAVDATDVLKIYIKIAVDKIEITVEELAYCDVNNDGAVNAVDASYILSYYAYTSTNSSEAKMSFEEYMKNN